jgi:hypothetical protein
MQAPFSSSNNKMSENPGKLACLLRAYFLLDILFFPEDGGDMCLRNINWVPTVYTAMHPRIIGRRLCGAAVFIFIFVAPFLCLKRSYT